MKSALERDVRLVRFEDGRLEIALEASAAKSLVNDLSKKLADWTGRRWMIAVSTEAGAGSLRAQAEARKAELKNDVRSDPLVQAVLARFPGAEIVEVRPPASAPPADCRTTCRPIARVTPMPDFLGLMKQAAELKSKMENMQAELDRMEVEGTAGGGMITVTLSGKGDLRHVKVDESLLKPDQKEIIEDLIVAAHADARRKLETMLQDKMQAMTGGLPLPPGLKLF